MSLIKKFKSLIFKRHRDRSQPELVGPLDRVLRIEGNEVAVGKFTYGVENISLIYHAGCPGLTIGRYCSIAQEVTIFLGAYHRPDWVSTYPFSSRHQNIWHHFGKIETPGFPNSNGAVTIGNDVWIGHAATIMSGLSIGDGAVIAANAHVVRDVLPYEIVGGNPAKHIRYRFSDAVIKRLLEVRWWEFPDVAVQKIAPQLCSEPNDDFMQHLLEIHSTIARNLIR
jgi:acetyltransferase-like isoleucine patch superfamily enzyme